MGVGVAKVGKFSRLFVCDMTHSHKTEEVGYTVDLVCACERECH